MRRPAGTIPAGPRESSPRGPAGFSTTTAPPGRSSAPAGGSLLERSDASDGRGASPPLCQHGAPFALPRPEPDRSARLEGFAVESRRVVQASEANPARVERPVLPRKLDPLHDGRRGVSFMSRPFPRVNRCRAHAPTYSAEGGPPADPGASGSASVFAAAPIKAPLDAVYSVLARAAGAELDWILRWPRTRFSTFVS